MPPKRKSDVLEVSDDGDEYNPTADATEAEQASSSKSAKAPPKKKTKKAAADSGPPTDADGNPLAWHQIKLEGEGEGGPPIYDDCNDIRRKIRALLQEPGFKVTHWLKEIGNVNSNSYGRFMKQSGPYGGADNSTYYSAYLYFEKRRIVEGKKKTPKRLRMEKEQAGGVTPDDARRARGGVWVLKT
ncbi:hypothetical protein PENSPDRAFT_664435 [Peniophora sp. CONT]|nr:hypothetical protein PENSPDRAFT_664435 [Peniophora sp. CONT]